MSSILQLFLAKKKARIRHTFAKPLSAILTILIILFYGYSLFGSLLRAGAGELDIETYHMFSWLSLVFAIGIAMLVCLQSRVALFFEEDSYYMFVGPFNNQQILSFLLLENFSNSLLTGAICTIVPLMIIGTTVRVPLYISLGTCLLLTVFFFLMTSIVDLVYIRDLIKEKKVATRKIIAIIMLVALVAFVAYGYVANGMEFNEAFIDYMLGNTFYYFPVFGWVRYVQVGLFYQNGAFIVIGVGLLVVVSAILNWAMIHTKGYFFEKAMQDATDYSAYYKRAMEGKQETNTKKLAKTKVRYKMGEAAIFSKNLLIMQKTRQFVSLQDLIISVLVIVLGTVMKIPFLFYCGLVLFYLLNSTGTSELVEELKQLYVYLLPGKGQKKLFYAMAIPVFKKSVFTLIMLVGGMIMMKPELGSSIVLTLAMLSFVILIFSGDVLSLRLLKSRNSKMIEMTLRMVFLTICCIPSVAIAVLAFLFIGNSEGVVIGVAIGVTVFNLLVSFVVTKLCADMMNGNAYMAD